MIGNKRIAVVMPAFNAERTLEQTNHEIPEGLVDEVILVDDCSTDQTVTLARKLGIAHVVRHQRNRGYGGNQKTCYRVAMELGCDIVVMLHPDYQYTPRLIPTMCHLISSGLYPVVLGSRILGKGALKGGMPMGKYVMNRVLTLFQNLLMGEKLSEYHTGFRAFSTDVLRAIPFERNSDDFVFDNQLLAQILFAGFEVAEITCPTHYFPEASSIGLRRGIKYSLAVIGVSLSVLLQRCRLARFRYLTFPIPDFRRSGNKAVD